MPLVSPRTSEGEVGSFKDRAGRVKETSKIRAETSRKVNKRPWTEPKKDSCWGVGEEGSKATGRESQKRVTRF